MRELITREMHSQQQSPPREGASSHHQVESVDYPLERTVRGSQGSGDKNVEGGVLHRLEVATERAKRLFITTPKGTELELYKSKLSREKEGAALDVFDVLAHLFGFQPDNVRNMRDSAVSVLVSRQMSSKGSHEPGPVLLRYRSEVLHNYTRWCKHLHTSPADFAKVCGEKDHSRSDSATRQTARAALETALYLLLWGEAANLRFCPEYLAFLFHKGATGIISIIKKNDTRVSVMGGGSASSPPPTYLEGLIKPAYELIAKELNKGVGGHSDVMNHVDIKNYDDFNEIFWRVDCLRLDLQTMCSKTSKGGGSHSLEGKFHKTFTERQSWSLCVFAFWRVHTMLIVSLHWLVVLNVCNRQSYCNVKFFLSPVVTLYICSLLKDVYDVLFAMPIVAKGGGSYLNIFLVALRGGIKAAVLVALAVGMLDSSDTLITTISTFALAWSLGSEALIWLGFSLYFGPYLNFLLGVDVVNLYTRVHRLTPLLSRIRYTLFWVVVMASKFAFSYFVVLTALVNSTFRVYKNDVGSAYNFAAFSISDEHNVTIIAAMWLGGVTVYFVDTHVWFVLWSNVVAAWEGLRRRVGEVNDSTSTVAVFFDLPKRFWQHFRGRGWGGLPSLSAGGGGGGGGGRGAAVVGREDVEGEMPTKRVVDREFALVWNEVARSWRSEDIIHDQDLLKLRYFAISTRRWQRVEKGRDKPCDMKERVSHTQVLEPEFIFSGALQRFEKTVHDFPKENMKAAGLISEYTLLDKRVRDLEGKAASIEAEQRQGRRGDVNIAKLGLRITDMKQTSKKMKNKTAEEQYRFLKARGARNKMTNLALEQLGTTLAMMLDSLCRDPRLSDALWGVQRAVKEGNNHYSQTLRAMAEAARSRLLFKAWDLPKVVQALTNLTKALNRHDWKACTKELNAVLQSIEAILDDSIQPEDGPTPQAKLLITHLNKLVRAIRSLRSSSSSSSSSSKEASGSTTSGCLALSGKRAGDAVFREFQKSNKVFLQRTQIFLQASSSSEPGHLQNDEALRRLRFFVNSMFVEQPRVGIVEAMPAFSTLTPYYKEDVLSQIEDLKDVTEDGVTVIEYLRTIYQDEWNAFVERMIRQNTLIDEVANHDGETKLQIEEEVADKEELILKLLERILFYVPNADDDEEESHFSTEQLDHWLEFEVNGGVGGGVAGVEGDGPQHIYGDTEGEGMADSGYDGMLIASTATAAEGGLMPADGGGRQGRGGGERPGSLGQSSATSGTSAPSAPSTTTQRQSISAMAETKRRKLRVKILEAQLEETVQTEVQQWASFRAQTLARTVRGFMMFGRAVRLLAAVEAKREFQPPEEQVAIRCPGAGSSGDGIQGGGILGGGGGWGPSMVVSNATLQTEDCREYDKSLGLALHAHRYVVAAQVFKAMKGGSAADKQKAKDIEALAREYPGLHIAYADQKDGRHYSVLEKWDEASGGMVEEYRVELPGKILLGEGKPNNQNHALIFTRGEAVQAVDMNQDKGLENALRCKQVMAEFRFGDETHPRHTPPNIGRIVGYREHVFTHNVSSPANFFSLQELNFVTATQRVVSTPLEVRFHYGHPDLFDKVTTMTMGGMSKSSKGVNLSEDIFAGFNWVLRGGVSTQADYIECGKGRDTGVSQITGFTAKISMGNGMQARSRDVNRLSSQFDFARLLSFYYSTVGGFMNQVFLILSIFVFMYSRVYLAFDPNTAELVNALNNLEGVSVQYTLQVGFLLIIPIPLVVAVEMGLVKAASTLAGVLLRLAPLFFIFSTGTNAHYTNSAIMAGQAKYQATGRGFAISHEPFLQSYKAFFVSHFQPAFELLVLLIIYGAYTPLPAYGLETFSVFLVVVGWMFVPIMYNPEGLDISYVQHSAIEWWAWMVSEAPEARSSWRAWFDGLLREDYQMMRHKKAEATVRRLRFALLAWGFFKKFNDDVESKRFNLAWVIVISLGVVTISLLVSLRRTNSKEAKSDDSFGAEDRTLHRLGALLFILVVIGVGILVLALTTADFGQLLSVVAGLLATFYFVSSVLTLWVKDAASKIGAVRTVFYTVHVAVGAVIQLPVLLLSLLPFLASLQTRMLFNAEFSDRFQIARIFKREKERQTVKLKRE